MFVILIVLGSCNLHFCWFLNLAKGSCYRYYSTFCMCPFIHIYFYPSASQLITLKMNSDWELEDTDKIKGLWLCDRVEQILTQIKYMSEASKVNLPMLFRLGAGGFEPRINSDWMPELWIHAKGAFMHENLTGQKVIGPKYYFIGFLNYDCIPEARSWWENQKNRLYLNMNYD